MDQIGLQAPYSFCAELDSGSQCTAITRTIFNMAFPNNILRRPPLTLHNFDGSLIMCIQGYFKSVARFNGHSCPVNIYVLDNSCAPVIGRDLITQLGMSINFGTNQV